MLKQYFTSSLPADAQSKDKIFLGLNIFIPVLMGIYILANPLPLASLNEICYYLSCAALIILLIFRKTDFTLRSPMTLPFALFSFWAVFGLFFALDLKNSVHDLRGHLLEYLIVFYLLVNFYSSRKRLEILSYLLIAGATVFSIGGGIGYYAIEGHHLTERMGYTFKEMHTGYIGFITILAALLSIYHFHRRKTAALKILFVFCFLANVAITILTQTRSSLIGLVAGLIILCFAEKKNIVLVIMLALMVAFMPGMKTRIENEGFTKDIRSKMYRLTWEVIKDHPIVGIGFGIETYGNKKFISLEKYNNLLPLQHQQRRVYQGQSVIISSTHSTILDIAVRTGFVGLILFLSIWATAAGMLWLIFRRNTRDEYFRSWVVYLFAGLVSYFLPSIFADASYGPRVAIFYIILAMIAILWNLSQDVQPGKQSQKAA